LTNWLIQRRPEENVAINNPSAAVPVPQQPDDWKITSIEEVVQIIKNAFADALGLHWQDDQSA
jgi:hypothetical protein